MSQEPSAAGKQLYSIGHSNQALERFLDLLRQHRIEVLVDVRSQPYSKYASQFNLDALRPAVTAAGVKYLFLGRELGGRPEGDAFYDAEDFVLYDRVAEAPLFRAGVARVLKGKTDYAVALMCSEEDPLVCHRHLLIGRVLVRQGVELHHIRGDGRIQTETELREEKARKRPRTLFDDGEEEAWRSLRPIPRRLSS